MCGNCLVGCRSRVLQQVEYGSGRVVGYVENGVGGGSSPSTSVSSISVFSASASSKSAFTVFFFFRCLFASFLGSLITFFVTFLISFFLFSIFVFSGHCVLPCCSKNGFDINSSISKRERWDKPPPTFALRANFDLVVQPTAAILAPHL